jgi:CelD/BcsL family acetyltransferase involved in cellulose biosynthesis
VKRIYEIDPLQDHRWPTFLEHHPQATLFHSPKWLGALQRTYGFRVGVLTSAGPGERLGNGLVFCRVRSWATGARLVSVPFSDHCAPLLESEAEFNGLWSHLKQECDNGRQKYLEIRSASVHSDGLANSARFCLHRLDLRPSLTDLFHAFHESCIRRKIARAQREGVSYEEGTSEELLNNFYRLNVLTRRRHLIPPQPLSWFRNLIACMGGDLKIRLANLEGRPVAGIMTIRFKTSMTYKYGCSDPHFHRLGTMQLLMWEAIQEAKADGLLEFDMGRTDWNNEGLLQFKDHWGSARSNLTYLRYPGPEIHRRTENIPVRVAKLFFTWAPSKLLTAAGGVLYPHIA